jgi:FkbM family methyltransferase
MNSTETFDEQFEQLKPYLLQVPSRVGEFLVYKNDKIVSQSIRLYGEYSQAEIVIMSQYLDETSIYLDIGTNIGYHAVAMQDLTKCQVMAFEPHPKHFVMAAVNCKERPIQIFNAAVSDKEEVITIDTFDESILGNFGDISINGKADKIEVQATTIDKLGLEKVDLMKIDVEGYEPNVLRGAEQTIDKLRPVIFYEAEELDKWNQCFKFLELKDYKQYWVSCRIRPVGNETFIKSEQDPFQNAGVSNILAVPAEIEQPDYLAPVVYNEPFNQLVDRYTRYKLVF